MNNENYLYNTRIQNELIKIEESIYTIIQIMENKKLKTDTEKENYKNILTFQKYFYDTDTFINILK